MQEHIENSSEKAGIEANFALWQVLASNQPTAYYSVNTVWWTHDPEALHNKGGIPKDPFGSVLFMAPLREFVKASTEKPEHFGKYGIAAFMAAHDLNITPYAQKTHIIPTGWGPVNDGLSDEVAARLADAENKNMGDITFNSSNI